MNSQSEPPYSVEKWRQWFLTKFPLKVHVKRRVLIYISMSVDLIVLKCNM